MKLLELIFSNIWALLLAAVVMITTLPLIIDAIDGPDPSVTCRTFTEFETKIVATDCDNGVDLVTIINWER